ncbi:hypothetical protein R1flu_021829 [Riccia fluitans]|uniref:Uncharacterized protein n=1 Tax=Riccia fluitans TaxID=41844 RepID=A0ABD1ZQH2_9MARC
MVRYTTYFVFVLSSCFRAKRWIQAGPAVVKFDTGDALYAPTIGECEGGFLEAQSPDSEYDTDHTSSSYSSSSDSGDARESSRKRGLKRKRSRSSNRDDSASSGSSSDEERKRRSKSRSSRSKGKKFSRRKEREDKDKKKDKKKKSRSSDEKRERRHRKKEKRERGKRKSRSLDVDPLTEKEDTATQLLPKSQFQLANEAQIQQKELVWRSVELAKAKLASGELQKKKQQQMEMQRLYGAVDWREKKKLRAEKSRLERTIAAGKKLAKIEERENARMDAFRVALGLPTAEAQRQAEWRAEATRALAEAEALNKDKSSPPISRGPSKPPKVIGPRLPS